MQLSNTRHAATESERLKDQPGISSPGLLLPPFAKSDYTERGEPINVSTTITDAVLLLFADGPSFKSTTQRSIHYTRRAPGAIHYVVEYCGQTLQEEEEEQLWRKGVA